MDYLDFLHGGDVYTVKNKSGKEIIDFSANINPLGLPPGVKKTIRANFDKLLHYPDPDAQNVTQVIAKYWGINENNILVGNGSVELIYLIMSAFTPKTALIPAPTFSEYERAARGTRSKIRFVELKEKKNFQLQKLNNTADIIFLCNPNNPTGNLFHPPALLRKAKQGGRLVVDEAFMDFLPDEKEHTLIEEACGNKQVIVLRTFTKFFALPGLRIGYLIAHQEVITKLRQYRIPWSVNAFAQLAAEVVLGDKKYIKKTRQCIEKERKYLFAEIGGIRQLNPYPSVTNFLLIKIKDKTISSSYLRKRLISKGILIRDCANFRGLNNKFIRVAIRGHTENLKLINALKAVFN